MDKFELEDRYLALKVLDIWLGSLLRSMLPHLNTNTIHRFTLKCKTRGLIAHDRVLTGRIV